MHIRRLANSDTVKLDCGNRIEPVTHEIHALSTPRCVSVESRGIAPIRSTNELEMGLIVIQVGVGNSSGSEKVGRDTARHSGDEITADEICTYVTPYCADGPVTAQFVPYEFFLYERHRRWSVYFSHVEPL